MKLILGNNEIIDCDAALVVNGVEVFRLRKRSGDERLVCDFDIRDKEGNRLAKVAKNNVVYAAEGHKVENIPRQSKVTDANGKVIACVQEIGLETIKVTGEFWIEGHNIAISDNGLVSGGITMSGNVINHCGKAISFSPGSYSIG